VNKEVVTTSLNSHHPYPSQQYVNIPSNPHVEPINKLTHQRRRSNSEPRRMASFELERDEEQPFIEPRWVRRKKHHHRGNSKQLMVVNHALKNGGSGLKHRSVSVDSSNFDLDCMNEDRLETKYGSKSNLFENISSNSSSKSDIGNIINRKNNNRSPFLGSNSVSKEARAIKLIGENTSDISRYILLWFSIIAHTFMLLIKNVKVFLFLLLLCA
jgi:hypothetical protein